MLLFFVKKQQQQQSNQFLVLLPTFSPSLISLYFLIGFDLLWKRAKQNPRDEHVKVYTLISNMVPGLIQTGDTVPYHHTNKSI